MTGLEVCARLKELPALALTPVILVTANSEPEDIVRGFSVGADDYLLKPFNYMELLARVRSMLRIRDATRQLRDANAALDELNRDLERQVKQQVHELERVNRLRRFFSPQIVDTIIGDTEVKLAEHRREITVVFLDLRNFTSFAEQADPQVVIHTIRQFHRTVGPVIFAYGGTLERFTGDGMMVFLGDPEPMADHPTQAVRMALEIRRAVAELGATWERQGYHLPLGIGIATGIASLGTIGFEGRLDYAAIGTVTNLAARLCSLAAGGQILLAAHTCELLPAEITRLTQFQGTIELKGFSQPQCVYTLG
jgi:class 3 adenylate cyclase